MGWGLIIPVMPRLIAQLKHIEINDASAYGAWLLLLMHSHNFFVLRL